jgi:hypothetical protein
MITFIYGTVENVTRLWQDMFSNSGFLIMLSVIIASFFYGFFRKDKTSREQQK